MVASKLISLLCASCALIGCGEEFSRADLRHAGNSYRSIAGPSSGLDIANANVQAWSMQYVTLPTAGTTIGQFKTTTKTGSITILLDGDTIGLGNSGTIMAQTTASSIIPTPTTVQSNLSIDLIPETLSFSNLPYVPLSYVQEAFSDILAVLNSQNGTSFTVAQAVQMLQAAQPQLFAFQTGVPYPQVSATIDPLTRTLWQSGVISFAYLSSTDPAFDASKAGNKQYALSPSCAGCHMSQKPVQVGSETIPFLEFGVRQAFSPADPQGFTREQMEVAIDTWLESGCTASSTALPFIATAAGQTEFCAVKALAAEAEQSVQSWMAAQGIPQQINQGNLNTLVGVTGYIVAMLNGFNVGYDMDQATTSFSQNMSAVTTNVYRSGGLYANLVSSLAHAYSSNGVSTVPENRGRVWPSTDPTGTTTQAYSFKYGYMNFKALNFKDGAPVSPLVMQEAYLNAATQTVFPFPSELEYVNPASYGFSSLSAITSVVFDRRLYNLDGSDIYSPLWQNLFFKNMNQNININQPIFTTQTTIVKGQAQETTISQSLLAVLGQPPIAMVSGQGTGSAGITAAMNSFSTYCSSCHGVLSTDSAKTVISEAAPTTPVESTNGFVAAAMGGLGQLRGAPASFQLLGSNSKVSETVSINSNGSTNSGAIGGLRPGIDSTLGFSPFADGLPCPSALADLQSAPGARTGAYVWVNWMTPWVSATSSLSPVQGVMQGFYPEIFATSASPSTSNDGLYGPPIYEANQVHPQLAPIPEAAATQICTLVMAAQQGMLYADDGNAYSITPAYLPATQ